MLNDDEKQLQTKKLTHLLQYVYSTIDKHFKAWVKRLAFIGIYGDYPMSRLIAKRIVGGNANIISRDIECTFQNKTINLRKYDEFICANIKNETVMAIQKLPCIVHHATALLL